MSHAEIIEMPDHGVDEAELLSRINEQIKTEDPQSLYTPEMKMQRAVHWAVEMLREDKGE